MPVSFNSLSRLALSVCSQLGGFLLTCWFSFVCSAEGDPIGLAAVISQKGQETLNQQSYEWVAARGISIRKTWASRWSAQAEWQHQEFETSSGALNLRTNRDLWLCLGRRLWRNALRTAMFIELGGGFWTGKVDMNFASARDGRRLDNESVAFAGLGFSTDVQKSLGLELWLRASDRQWAGVEPWMGLAIWGQWDLENRNAQRKEEL